MNKILNKHKLTKPNVNRKKQIKSKEQKQFDKLINNFYYDIYQRDKLFWKPIGFSIKFLECDENEFAGGMIAMKKMYLENGKIKKAWKIEQNSMVD